MNANYLVEYRGFTTRLGTSDQKAIDEVVTKSDYERSYFKPEKNDVWVDLGANIGAFSRHFAPRVSKIYAYEPTPSTFEILRINTEDLDNVFIFQNAVTNKADIIPFYERPSQNWRNSTRKMFKDSVLTFVKSIPAKDLPKDANAIKIDIEGSELEIMNNLNLNQYDKLIMEWSFDFLPEVKYYREAVALLEKHFDVVKYSPVKADIWQKNWFPPCKKIIAYNHVK